MRDGKVALPMSVLRPQLVYYSKKKVTKLVDKSDYIELQVKML
jgi:hypothetical protein